MPRPRFMSPRTGRRICSKLWRCRGIQKSASCRPRMYMKLSGEFGSPLSMCWKEMVPVGWSLTQAVSSKGTIFMGSSEGCGSGGGGRVRGGDVEFRRRAQHEAADGEDGDGAG